MQNGLGIGEQARAPMARPARRRRSSRGPIQGRAAGTTARRRPPPPSGRPQVAIICPRLASAINSPFQYFALTHGGSSVRAGTVHGPCWRAPRRLSSQIRLTPPCQLRSRRIDNRETGNASGCRHLVLRHVLAVPSRFADRVMAPYRLLRFVKLGIVGVNSRMASMRPRGIMFPEDPLEIGVHDLFVIHR